MDIGQYRKINSSFKRKVVFKLGMRNGFFSEYNNMVLAMAYCLTHKIQFVLSSDGANFSPEKGWTGFFEPFCDDVASETGSHYTTTPWKYALKRLVLKRDCNALKSLLHYLPACKDVLLTQDVFGKCRDPKWLRHECRIDGLNKRCSFLELCSELVGMTWRYNPEVRKEVDGYISALALPAEYVGFHIRGG